MRYATPTITRFANCHRQVHEQAPQNDLAVTPARMMEMAEAGIPISAVNQEYMYDDGQRTVAFEPPLERQRRVELGDLWENQMEIRKKAKRFFQDSKAQEGGE